jgi:hypothetical protein
MNKVRLIKNRLTVNWTGTSKLNIQDIEKINRKRYWIRLNKKKYTVYINGLLKFYKNEEND